MTERAAAGSGTAADGVAAEQRKITARAAVVAAGTLGSRLLGLVRDQVMAALFSRAMTDAFFVAFTLPNVLRQLLGEGAVQSAVLPVLATTREQQGDDAARRFFAAIRGLSLCLLTIATALGVVFAEALVDLFAVGFREIPGQFERTVLLTRWLFPYILLVGTAALGVAALNVYQRFVVSSFAPALLNVAFIGFALALPGPLGARGYDPALSLVVAVLVGGVLQVVAQWPSLRRIGFLGWPSFNFSHPGVRAVLRRMGPVLLGMGVYYVDVLLARRFLSELGLGAQSYFSWALRLCDFPQGILVMALQTAALPSLSRFAARGAIDDLTRTFAFGMRLTLFVALPATVLAVTLAEPLVVLLFQRGAFDAESARETARALVGQGSGIFLVAAVRQLVSVYYAVGDTRTPLAVAAVDLAAFILAAVTLRGPFGHVGVSMAVTAASAVQAALLWALLGRHLPERGAREVGRSLLRTIPATALAGGAAHGAAAWVAAAGGARAWEALAGAAAGICVFGCSAYVFRSPELMTLLSRTRRSR